MLIAKAGICSTIMDEMEVGIAGSANNWIVGQFSSAGTADDFCTIITNKLFVIFAYAQKLCVNKLEFSLITSNAHCFDSLNEFHLHHLSTSDYVSTTSQNTISHYAIQAGRQTTTYSAIFDLIYATNTPFHTAFHHKSRNACGAKSGVKTSQASGNIIIAILANSWRL